MSKKEIINKKVEFEGLSAELRNGNKAKVGYCKETDGFFLEGTNCEKSKKGRTKRMYLTAEAMHTIMGLYLTICHEHRK